MISKLSSKRMSVSRILLPTLLIAIAVGCIPAYAAQPNSSKQNPDEKDTVATLVPYSCSERVTATIRGVGSWQIQKLRNSRLQLVVRAEQEFRLAVLEGDEVRVRQLEQMFANQAESAKGPWANAEDRINALQVSLDDAALANQPALIRLLVQYGAKLDYANEPIMVPAIVVAAKCGNIATMSALSALGADLSAPINPKDEAPTAARTAIEVAVEARQNIAIMWLLHQGVDVCNMAEAKRIKNFITHPLAKGRLSEAVLTALQCTTVPASAQLAAPNPGTTDPARHMPAKI